MELLMNVTTYVIVFVPTDNVDLIGAIRRLIAEPGPDGNIQQYDKEYEIALLEKRAGICRLMDLSRAFLKIPKNSNCSPPNLMGRVSRQFSLHRITALTDGSGR